LHPGYIYAVVFLGLLDGIPNNPNSPEHIS